MREFCNQNYDQERAFYGENEIFVHDCTFAGPADGESAFKECRDVRVEKCEFDLRYPFWHVHGLNIRACELKETCRAALWYSDGIDIANTQLHGIKALRCGIRTALTLPIRSCTASRRCASAATSTSLSAPSALPSLAG